VINPHATWSLVAQIASDIPIHEKHLKRLADERDAIASDATD